MLGIDRRQWTRAAVALVLFGSSACLSPDFLRDPPSLDVDQTIHVVVENPAGSQEKWEVRANGRMTREFDENGPVRIPYLPWPVNGGMIPRTLLSAELGGDGEPLDVLLLGPSVARGTVVRAVPIGLLEVIDHLERDDKVLAVEVGSPLGDLKDASELEEKHPGVREILATWYAHSRPGGGMHVRGYRNREAALMLIREAAVAFENAIETDSLPEWETP